MRPNPSPDKAGQLELYKVELNRIVKKEHALVRLSHKIDWERFERRFEVCYSPDTGRPGIATRLLVGLHYLKYSYGLSDEAVLAGWLENPYWQYFCGGRFFEHTLPLEVSTMSRWRKKVGESGSEELLAETIRSGVKEGIIKAADLKRVNVDSTVQTKEIRYPTDSRLYDRMRERLVKEAEKEGIELRQSYRFVGKKAYHRQSGYGRAKQYKRAGKETRKLKTYLGRVARDIERKTEGNNESVNELLRMSKRLLAQGRHDKKKLYSVHAPEVECISKGKIHKRYEFGCKVGLVTTAKNNWIIGVKAFHGNPYDGHTLSASIKQAEKITKREIEQAICDLGYRGHNYTGDCKIGIVPRNRKIKSRWKRYWWNRRSAIEPVIGHMKESHRLERNKLSGEEGDRLNAVFSACGFNLRKLLRVFLRFFVLRFERRCAPLMCIPRFI
jgi:IS5 family transposase